MLTYERIVGPFFFYEDIIISNLFPDTLENCAHSQLSNSSNFIPQLDFPPVHFAHIFRNCLNMNFPGRWVGIEQFAWWPSHFLDLMPLRFFIWGHVHSQRVNTLDDLQAQITAATADITQDMLQHPCQKVDYRWDVCRAVEGVHCEVFHT
jgi:hypothetical protein